MKFVRRLLFLGLLAGGFLIYRALSPYQGFQGELFVDIPRGTSTDGIAEILANNGVVRSRYDFLLARMTERGRVLKAGEYRFDHPASPIEVFDRLARGDVFALELVVPEGKNMFDIAVAAEQLKLFSAAEFLNWASMACEISAERAGSAIWTTNTPTWSARRGVRRFIVSFR